MRRIPIAVLASFVGDGCTKEQVRPGDADGGGVNGACTVAEAGSATMQPCREARDCKAAGDRCLELGSNGCGTCLPDADDDGIANIAPARCAASASAFACDNCPDIANADQADQDSDHLGDACDANPKVANYELHRGTLAPSGGLSVGGTHDAVGTAGQPTAGAGELRTNRYRLRAGFGGASSASQHP